MAPVKSMKTYSRFTNPSESNISKNLFRLNLKKRNTFKKKWSGELQIKDLDIPQSSQLSNNSLNITVNDTFDKLLKGDVYQPVVLEKTMCYYTSNSDRSKSALHSFTVSDRVHSSRVSKRIKRKSYRKKKKNTKKNLVCKENVPKSTYLDESVYTSPQVEKNSLFRYTNMTTESILFGAPIVCSTPAKKHTTLIENDVKLSMIPFVRLHTNFSDYKQNSVNVTKNTVESNVEEQGVCSATSPSFWFAHKTKEKDSAFAIKPLKFEQSFSQISCNTPIDFVNKKRRGCVKRIISNEETSRSNSSIKIESSSCLEE